jgi:hypothetical protein
VTAKADKPKRLSLSEILQLVLTRQVAEPSAVTISRSASGETLLEVKVKAAEDGGANAVEEAAHRASLIYEELQQQYPSRAGQDDASIKLTRNAKGDTQIEVDTKTNAHGGVATLDELEAKAQTTYDRLRRQYPLADGTTTRS